MREHRQTVIGQKAQRLRALQKFGFLPVAQIDGIAITVHLHQRNSDIFGNSTDHRVKIRIVNAVEFLWIDVIQIGQLLARGPVAGENLYAATAVHILARGDHRRHHAAGTQNGNALAVTQKRIAVQHAVKIGIPPDPVVPMAHSRID